MTNDQHTAPTCRLLRRRIAHFTEIARAAEKVHNKARAQRYWTVVERLKATHARHHV